MTGEKVGGNQEFNPMSYISGDAVLTLHHAPVTVKAQESNQ